MNDNNNNQDLPLGLYWKGKRTTVDRIVLSLLTFETLVAGTGNNQTS